MHKHHIIPKSKGGTDDYIELKSPYDHAYDHALDFVLFDNSPRFDFRHEAWPLLPEDLRKAVLTKHAEIARSERLAWFEVNEHPLLGSTRPEETKLKISQSLKGKKRVFTDEHKANLSRANKGKRPSEACIQAVIQSNKRRSKPK